MPFRFFRRRSIIWTVFSTFVAILAFFILLTILDFSFSSSGNAIIRGLLSLLKEDFYLLIVIALILMTGEIFDRFSFPLDLPAPLFHALASVFLIIFIFDVFRYLDGITGANIYQNLEILRILLSILIFLIVFIGGYFKIFGDLLITGRQRELRAEPPAASSDVKTWDDIGNEFRLLVFDVLRRMREELRGGED